MRWLRMRWLLSIIKLRWMSMGKYNVPKEKKIIPDLINAPVTWWSSSISFFCGLSDFLWMVLSIIPIGVLTMIVFFFLRLFPYYSRSISLWLLITRCYSDLSLASLVVSSWLFWYSRKVFAYWSFVICICPRIYPSFTLSKAVCTPVDSKLQAHSIA